MTMIFERLQLFLFLLVKLMSILSSQGDRENEIQNKVHSYDRLCNDIMNRPEAVHKISPDQFHETNSSYDLSFMVWLVDISDIDEINQVITINLFIDIRWKQEGLSWNKSDYDEIDLVRIEATKLWTPVILVVMGDKDSFVLQFSQILIVTSEGEVVSTRHNYLTFTCNIDFHKYPFDVQTCNVGFFPTGNNSTPLIKIRDIIEYPLSTYSAVNGEWLLENVSHDIVRTSDGWSNIPRYNFTMRRQRTYYVITFIFPFALTSVMIPLVFLIPAQSGEKISYIVAVFTSTAIFINYISDVMPRSLSRLPYLAMFLLEVLIEGFLALIASLLVLNLYLSEDKRGENKANCLQRQFQNTKNEKTSKSTYDVNNLCPSRVRCCVTSRELDFIFFFLFTSGQGLFLWIVFGMSDWL